MKASCSRGGYQSSSLWAHGGSELALATVRLLLVSPFCSGLHSPDCNGSTGLSQGLRVPVILLREQLSIPLPYCGWEGEPVQNGWRRRKCFCHVLVPEVVGLCYRDAVLRLLLPASQLLAESWCLLQSARAGDAPPVSEGRSNAHWGQNDARAMVVQCLKAAAWHQGCRCLW